MSRCIVPFLLALLLAAVSTTATAAPIVYGVNAHDNRPGYSMAQAEARFQLLAARNLRSYRFDVDPRDCAEIYTGNTTGDADGGRGCYDSLAQLLRNLRDNYADVVSEVNVYELLDQTTIQGAEGHFGLMYDLTRPKPTLDLLTRFAQAPATATAADAPGDRPR
ncbi:hypothetical protein [Xanthomonas arboricola]|uniref:Uncharacterized protein n=1 Tax=Xanthomonas arboricola pv. guizotiae TaxID=487867 RepID=A0A2S6ZRK8_9XANT|nr:hypothetical protein [Xanthomonas arboricola]PPT94877.1 hypothetical protein XarbCFBP7409_18505 [Xanthomonas arboricola pv. guizotiae]PPU19169.1 hypothetical protein XarbCFBP7408_19465 [Xanthomonas arboricola pv. guizotiae]